MKKYISAWIASKNPKVMLGNHCAGKGLYYETYEFMGQDERYYVCGFIYDESKVIPYTESSVELFLGMGESTEAPVSDEEERGLLAIFESALMSYPSLEEFKANRPKKLDKSEMEKMLLYYYQGIKQRLLEQSFGSFQVSDVEMTGHSAVVFFKKKGYLQSPIRMQLGEPTLVKRRNYGDLNESFEEFVEGLGDLTGGIVWR